MRIGVNTELIRLPVIRKDSMSAQLSNIMLQGAPLFTAR